MLRGVLGRSWCIPSLFVLLAALSLLLLLLLSAREAQLRAPGRVSVTSGAPAAMVDEAAPPPDPPRSPNISFGVVADSLYYRSVAWTSFAQSPLQAQLPLLPDEVGCHDACCVGASGGGGGDQHVRSEECARNMQVAEFATLDRRRMFDMADFVQRAANGSQVRVLFLGDSVTGQVFESCLCNLRRSAGSLVGLTREVVALNALGSDWRTRVGKIDAAKFHL
jgi:hypothetical protein